MRPARYRWARRPFPGGDPVLVPVPDREEARRREGPVVRWLEDTLGRPLRGGNGGPGALAPLLTTPEGLPAALDLSEEEAWACWWHLLAEDDLRAVAALHAALFDYLQAGELEAARVTVYALVDRLLEGRAP